QKKARLGITHENKSIMILLRECDPEYTMKIISELFDEIIALASAHNIKINLNNCKCEGRIIMLELSRLFDALKLKRVLDDICAKLESLSNTLDLINNNNVPNCVMTGQA